MPQEPLVGHALGEDWDAWEPDSLFRGKGFALEHPTSTGSPLWPKPELSCVIYPAQSQLSTWPGISTACSANALSQLLGSTYSSLFFNEISLHEMCWLNGHDDLSPPFSRGVMDNSGRF